MSAENYPLIREPRSLDYSSINATAVGETDKATRNANDDSKCCNKFTKAYLDVPFVARDCFPCVFSPKEYFMNKLPVLQTVFMKYWQKRYVKSVSFFVADLIAGLTVGLMLVPQALAYAKIAGLSPEYGLYSSFMGCFVYFLFGTSKDITLGPTAIMSLIVASLVSQLPNPVPYAVALSLLVGITQFLMGILNLGFIVDFIPHQVISGFTSAAAITIAAGQIKELFGLQIPSHGANSTIASHSHSFIDTIKETVEYLPTTRLWDAVLGFLSMGLCIFLRLFKKHIEKMMERKVKTVDQKIALRFLWLLCTANNAVVVLIGALIGYSLCAMNSCDSLSLIKDVSGGLPQVQLPHISLPIFQYLNFGIAIAAIIGFLESIAIAKAFARKNDYKVDPSQELIALGLGNIAGSMVQGYPITGSFSRTAVNAQSGVKTPLAGIITGSVVLLALSFVSSAFKFIPQVSLAAIIITSVLYMVDFKTPIEVWKIRKIDLLPLIVSFLGTLLLDIKYGVPAACALNIIYLLFRSARPRIKVSYSSFTIHFVLNGGLNYPGIDFFARRVHYELDKANKEGRKVKAVFIDGSKMPDIDYAVLYVLEELISGLFHQNLQVTLILQDQIKGVVKSSKMQKCLTLVATAKCLKEHQTEHNPYTSLT